MSGIFMFLHMVSGLTEDVQELLDFVCVSWFPVLVKLHNSRVSLRPS